MQGHSRILVKRVDKTSFQRPLFCNLACDILCAFGGEDKRLCTYYDRRIELLGKIQNS